MPSPAKKTYTQQDYVLGLQILGNRLSLGGRCSWESTHVAYHGGEIKDADKLRYYTTLPKQDAEILKALLERDEWFAGKITLTPAASPPGEERMRFLLPFETVVSEEFSQHVAFDVAKEVMLVKDGTVPYPVPAEPETQEQTWRRELEREYALGGLPQDGRFQVAWLKRMAGDITHPETGEVLNEDPEKDSRGR